MTAVAKFLPARAAIGDHSAARTAPAPGAPDLTLALTALSLALVVILLPGVLLDPRQLGGSGVWVKPLKFAISFVLFFGTLAVVVARMSPAARGERWTRWAGLAMGASMIGEMAYMVRQAGLGEASHFNVGTPFHAFMYTLMGIGAAVLVIGVGIVGWRFWRDPGARTGPGLRLGVLLGFAGSMVLTLFVAFTLGGNGGHYVGTPSEGAAVFPLFGWSAEVGDLRPAHFLSLHAMQALPLLGYWLDRAAPAHARSAVSAGAATWAALTLAVFAQALAGLPLIAL